MMRLNSFRPAAPDRLRLFEKVVARLGYPSPSVLSEEVRLGIERAVDRALEQARVESVLRRATLVKVGGGMIEGQGIRIHSQRWARVAERAEKPAFIFAFVVTLGQRLDETVAALQRDSFFDAYLLDAAGSELAEESAGALEEFLASQAAAEGMEITARFSPGYCDWDLKEGQDALFRFLDTGSVGVRCNEAGMMTPLKTISGVVIAAPRLAVRVACSWCNQRECLHRRSNGLAETDKRV
jgi:hypothetical protein